MIFPLPTSPHIQKRAFTNTVLPANIVSIQTFEITIATGATTGTATITAVDTTKAVIFWGGFSTTNTATDYYDAMSRMTLTNATTITGTRHTSSATHAVTMRGTIVEFSSTAVQSVQYGTVTIGGSDLTGTASITGVDITRSAIFYLGLTVNGFPSFPRDVYSRVELTDTDTVTATRGNADASIITVSYCVVQFGQSVIASVQQKTKSVSGTELSYTDSVANAVLGRSILLYNGVSTSSLGNARNNFTMQLTDESTVTFTRGSSTSTTSVIGYTTLVFAGNVIESIQRGTTPMVSVASANTDITAVDTSLSVCNMNGFLTSNDNSLKTVFPTARLADTDTVSAARGDSFGTCTPSWEVIEFAA